MIKILLGGSPCTFWSIAQKNNRETEAEGLGWELFKNYLIAKEKFKPDFFLYENNKSAAQPIKDQISRELGVDLMYINSALVSAQWRERFYAFNWEVEQPTDRKIYLKDVLEIHNDLPTSDKIIMTKSDFKVKVRKHYIDKKELALFLREKKEQARKTNKEIATFCNVPLTLAEHWFRLDNSFSIPDAEIWEHLKQCLHITEKIYDKAITEFELKNNVFDMAKRIYHINGKHPTLTTCSGGHQRKTITDGDDLFYLEPLHCERLQTLPDNYTQGVSDRQRFKALGNGWTAEVIIHILNGALKDVPRDEEIVVLSMYDGIGTGRYCLDKMGFTNVKYYAYEIDKYAKQVAMSNYPDIIQCGDAFDLRHPDWTIGY
jgi:DNA (cytosine-5)-methyltransferase 3A